MEVTTVGIDLAKNVFQVHGVDGRGKVVLRRQTRSDVCVLATETAQKVVSPIGSVLSNILTLAASLRSYGS
jgi:hypothetical protein